ncbi:Grx4 family monothiol glutaredoxin [Thiohalobacter sp.]|uniref:Grx4 family monothiol glutaredoxin n=1 Tax=Thiohalobacter sp. TaxID=2025948 RepID=UPI002614CEE9|nr:Grx4 family monothiol glutaredoxin [Thiohalobacter sp.]
MDVMERIQQAVDSHPVVIFMKGTPQMPMCGYSSRAAQALQACGEEFAYVNVLADPEIFENLPRFQNWPTFPQIYINGELIGGCDITLELYQKGELQKMVKEAVSGAGGKSEEEAS